MKTVDKSYTNEFDPQPRSGKIVADSCICVKKTLAKLLCAIHITLVVVF